MNEKLFYPLNLQLFAEGGEGNEPTPPAGSATPPNVEIDYNKLAEVVAGREQVAGDAALKGYFKSQGLSKEECDAAITAYKQAEKNKQAERDKEYQKIIDENKAYKKAEAMKAVKENAKAVAKELNVRDDRFDKLFKLCDTSNFTKEDGKIDKDAIKTEFEEQLKDLPEFTQKKRIVISTGNGFNGNPQELTDAEKYRQQKYGKSKYYKG